MIDCRTMESIPKYSYSDKTANPHSTDSLLFKYFNTMSYFEADIYIVLFYII